MMGMISASSSCAFLISFGLSPSGMTLVQLTSMVSFVILMSSRYTDTVSPKSFSGVFSFAGMITLSVMYWKAPGAADNPKLSLITVYTFLPNPASPLEVVHSPQLLED
ncbi:Bifunctional heparan sulfate N-deacetylase/N-sulfotransferase 1 [Frankliniella fusca]|uniref:Bifunctional heparan sulfate N-deacetylase/N-sulfotransferase 1 n=1 Tax=Frankliniella fusca TaxID=407009 RepID=A0AAE1LNS2_9NEOP|nr:Bifunctional heparan sulfate N-deacetylase/N-sulfotransferase 1 [Frankliniella fusca]